MKKGIFEIPFGESWLKGQSINPGMVPLRQYQPALKRLIKSGRAKPSFILDRELRIEDAPEAYKEFSDHDFIKSAIRLDDGENGVSLRKRRWRRSLPRRKGGRGI